jgi:hypothetical protein
MTQQDKEGKRRILPTRKEAKGSNTPPSKATLRAIRVLFDRYAEEVDLSDLSQSSKTMYIDFANCFIRWMNGGFQPGLRKPGKPRSNMV